MIGRMRGLAAVLVGFEIWAVALCVAAGVLSTRALPVTLGVAVCFWVVRWLATGRLSVRTPGDWAIGLLLLMIPVTLWATELPDITRTRVLQFLTGVALYYTVVNWGRLRWLALGQTLYPDPVARPTSDIDFVIEELQKETSTEKRCVTLAEKDGRAPALA